MVKYLNQSFIEFFNGLEMDNSTLWFDEHRREYLKNVKDPFKLLVTDTIDLIRVYNPKIDIKPQEAIFRINRDIRFSKDKTPYTTWVSAAISPMGKKDDKNAGFYFRFTSDQYWIGGGIHWPSTGRLKEIRKKIINDPDKFYEILNDKNFKKTFGDLKSDEVFKVLPKEIKAHVDEIPELYYKNFFAMQTGKINDFIKAENQLNFITDKYLVIKPFLDFLS